MKDSAQVVVIGGGVEGVGLSEISTFARHEIVGPGAHALLDRLLANRLPKTGRIALSPMLNHDGTLMGDLTVAKLGSERYWLFGSGAYEDIHQRWFKALDGGAALIRKLNQEYVGLSVAGPRSRDTLRAKSASRSKYWANATRPPESMAAFGIRKGRA